MRTSKTVNGVKTSFTLINGRITSQSDGVNKLYFRYDHRNQLSGVNINGTEYIYVLNNKGDITKIIDISGNIMVNYSYDAWGVCAITSGNLTIGNLNPMRYRGYYFDTETELYYLQSRYYDPETGRFINSDYFGVLTVSQDNILGVNLFIYCMNNPVNNIDKNGYVTVSLKYSFPTIYSCYGADQSWYEDAYRKARGCAPVAAANLLAYLGKYNKPLSNLYPYNYDFYKKDFIKFMNTMWDYVTPGFAGFWWMGDFVNCVEKYAQSKNLKSLKGYWSDQKANFKNAVQYIMDGLNRNCPVVLVMHDNWFLGEYDMHWMVITALEDNRNRNGKGDVITTISTWGGKRTFDFKKVVDWSTYWCIMYFTW